MAGSLHNGFVNFDDSKTYDTKSIVKKNHLNAWKAQLFFLAWKLHNMNGQTWCTLIFITISFSCQACIYTCMNTWNCIRVWMGITSWVSNIASTISTANGCKIYLHTAFVKHSQSLSLPSLKSWVILNNQVKMYVLTAYALQALVRHAPIKHQLLFLHESLLEPTDMHYQLLACLPFVKGSILNTCLCSAQV